MQCTAKLTENIGTRNARLTSEDQKVQG